jgi:hypothetical protein
MFGCVCVSCMSRTYLKVVRMESNWLEVLGGTPELSSNAVRKTHFENQVFFKKKNGNRERIW